jgi:hypothetical protein
MPVLILLNWVILIINLCSCLSNHLNGSELTCQFHLPFPKSLVDMTNCSCTCHFVACHANIASCTHPYHCHPLNAQRRPTIVATPPLPLAMRRLNKRPAVHVVSPYPPYRYCHRGPMAAKYHVFLITAWRCPHNRTYRHDTRIRTEITFG